MGTELNSFKEMKDIMFNIWKKYNNLILGK